MAVLGYEWNIYGFTLLLLLDILCRFCGRVVVHGSVLTVLLVVQRMHFFEGDTGIGVHRGKHPVCQSRAVKLLYFSLPVPLSLCPSLPLPAAAALYRYSVCALILWTVSAGKDASGQGMQFYSLSLFWTDQVSRMQSVRRSVGWHQLALPFFPLKVCLNWIVPARQECITHCLTCFKLLLVTCRLGYSFIFICWQLIWIQPWNWSLLSKKNLRTEGITWPALYFGDFSLSSLVTFV